MERCPAIGSSAPVARCFLDEGCSVCTEQIDSWIEDVFWLELLGIHSQSLFLFLKRPRLRNAAFSLFGSRLVVSIRHCWKLEFAFEDAAGTAAC